MGYHIFYCNGSHLHGTPIWAYVLHTIDRKEGGGGGGSTVGQQTIIKGDHTDSPVAIYTVKNGKRHLRSQPWCHLPTLPGRVIPAKKKFSKWHPDWGRECR